MIDVFALNGAKELLTNMTPAERGLFLPFGCASNQVNVLWKLVTVATNETPDGPVEQRVSGAQTQIVVRLLVGVLFEAWRLVQGRLLGTELGKEFVPQLNDAASQAAHSDDGDQSPKHISCHVFALRQIYADSDRHPHSTATGSDLDGTLLPTVTTTRKSGWSGSHSAGPGRPR